MPVRLFRFGIFELNVETRELLKRGARVKLQDQPFQLLVMLLENEGALVTREDVRLKLWDPDTFVNFEQGLGTAVKKIRQALGDDADVPRYIETVPKRGYRFIAPVARIDEEPVEIEAVEPAVPISAPLQAEVAQRRTPRVLYVSVLLLFGAAAALWLGSRLLARRTPAPPSAERITERVNIRPLTKSGNVVTAAISPDGSLVAYVTESGGKPTLLLRQTDAPATTEVIPPLPVHYWGLTFSRDGSSLYVVRSEQGEPAAHLLWRVPVFGGGAVQLAMNVDSPITVSPDGKQIAFVRVGKQGGDENLMIANADGSGERSLLTGYPFDLSGPSWSPDGRRIAVSCFVHRYGVAIISVDRGMVQHLETDRYAFVHKVAWLSDSRLAVTGGDRGLSGSQLWEADYPEGSVRRLTNDATEYAALTVNSEGNRLLAVQRSAPAAIWVGSPPEFQDLREIAKDPVDFDFMQAMIWISSGHILYSSKAAGSLDIWDLDPATRRAFPIVSDGLAHPWIAGGKDGKAVIVTMGGEKHLIEKLDLANMARSPLATTPIGGCPDISPDSKRVVFIDGMAGTHLMEISEQGGPLIQLAKSAQCFPRISPDGTLVAYNYIDANAKRIRTEIIPLKGGPAVTTLDLPPDSEWQLKRDFQWSPDGKALTYPVTRNGVANIWRMPIAGGPAVQLTHFTTDRIFSFAWSRKDGRLAVVRGSRLNDIVEIRLNR